MPVTKLISSSIPHGSWPAGGEVNLDYKNSEEFKSKQAKITSEKVGPKLKHTTLITSGVNSVLEKYDKLLRQAMSEYINENKSIKFDENEFLDFLQKDTGIILKNYDQFYVYNLIDTDPSKKNALKDIYEQAI